MQLFIFPTNSRSTGYKWSDRFDTKPTITRIPAFKTLVKNSTIFSKYPRPEIKNSKSELVVYSDFSPKISIIIFSSSSFDRFAAIYSALTRTKLATRLKNCSDPLRNRAKSPSLLHRRHDSNFLLEFSAKDVPILLNREVRNGQKFARITP